MEIKPLSRFSPSDFEIVLDDDVIAELDELIKLKAITTQELPYDLREALLAINK